MADDNVQHGIDDNPSGDAGKGAVLGGLGGAAVGAVAGGPIGAVVGAIAGAIASGAAVAAVDQVDNDDTVSGVGSNSGNAGANQSDNSNEYATTGAGSLATGTGHTGTVGADIPTLNVSRGETSANTMPDNDVNYHQNTSSNQAPLEGTMANNETHRTDINYQDPDIVALGNDNQNQNNQGTYATTDVNNTDVVGTGASHAGVGTTANVGATQNADHIRVPVVEEELNVQKQVQQAGEVQVRKDVITEQVNVPVELTREEVVVTRHAVNRDLQPGEHALGEEEVLRVPVSEETVSVSKQAHVVEEIDISKQRVTEHQNVTDTVRKEVVDVDDTTTHNANIGDTNRNNTF